MPKCYIVPKLAAAGLAAALSPTLLNGQEIDVVSAEQLRSMTLEQLLETRIVSLSRTLDEWTSAPAAIEVLTQEEIRRSGAVRLPDALRYATGLHVARGLNDAYVITARGFASPAGNKMQVLMDGRSLYTPLFSGVFWEVQDTLLEDIDRIEIVRGPGATLWGANAVNGVINFITRSAKDTQGLLVMGGGGAEESGFAGVRYGGRAGEQTYYRAYMKYQNRDEQVFAFGPSADDGMQEGRAGFRTDSFLKNNLLTVQGEAYYNTFGLAGRPDAENPGGNLLARWTQDFSDTSQLQVQAYYDRSIRDIPLQFSEDRNTWDLEFHHSFAFQERHRIVWGGHYRHSMDETGDASNRTFRFSPEDRSVNLVSGFLQDEITLVPERLAVTLGSKIEHNDFSGFEYQPSGRIALTPTDRQTIWAAISRAVRTPTRVDTDVRFFPVPATGLVALRGNEGFESEELLAYELGYRVQPHKRVFLDVATFYNEYDKLRTVEPSNPSAPTLPPFVLKNELEGRTYGAEFSVKYQVTDWWRVTSSYTFLQEDLEPKPGSFDANRGSAEANDPQHTAGFRSVMDLPGNLELDGAIRYVDRLPRPRIAGYVALDLRFAWHVTPNLELAIIGHNLLDDRHPEFPAGARQPEVQRAVFGRFTFRY